MLFSADSSNESSQSDTDNILDHSQRIFNEERDTKYREKSVALILIRVKLERDKIPN